MKVNIWPINTVLNHGARVAILRLVLIGLKNGHLCQRGLECVVLMVNLFVTVENYFCVVWNVPYNATTKANQFHLNSLYSFQMSRSNLEIW